MPFAHDNFLLLVRVAAWRSYQLPHEVQEMWNDAKISVFPDMYQAPHVSTLPIFHLFYNGGPFAKIKDD